MPTALAASPHARAFYGTFKLALGEAFFASATEDQSTALVNEALMIEKILDQAIAEHSLSTQDMEASVRQQLLPRLFTLIGMDKAREVIDLVLQIARVGMSRRGE